MYCFLLCNIVYFFESVCYWCIYKPDLVKLLLAISLEPLSVQIWSPGVPYYLNPVLLLQLHTFEFTSAALSLVLKMYAILPPFCVMLYDVIRSFHSIVACRCGYVLIVFIMKVLLPLLQTDPKGQKTDALQALLICDTSGMIDVLGIQILCSHFKEIVRWLVCQKCLSLYRELGLLFSTLVVLRGTAPEDHAMLPLLGH